MWKIISEQRLLMKISNIFLEKEFSLFFKKKKKLPFSSENNGCHPSNVQQQIWNDTQNVTLSVFVFNFFSLCSLVWNFQFLFSFINHPSDLPKSPVEKSFRRKKFVKVVLKIKRKRDEGGKKNKEKAPAIIYSSLDVDHLRHASV